MSTKFAVAKAPQPLPPPSIKARILAFLLDYIIILGYMICLGVLALFLNPYLRPLFTGSPGLAETTGFFLITLPVTLYFVLGERSQWQGTWGKRKMGLKVVDRLGNRIGSFQAVVRSVVKFLPWEAAHFVVWRLVLPSGYSASVLTTVLILVYVVVFLYLLSPFTNRSRRTIYDWVSGTMIITK